MAEVMVWQRTKKMPDGTISKCGWAYRFEMAPVNGKRQRCQKGGFKRKADAQVAGNAAFAEYNNTGMTFSPSDMSVADYLDLWIDEYCKINLKGTTVSGYKKKIKNHIKPALGQYRLSAITSVVIQKFLNDKFNEGYSRNTLTSMKGILNGSLNYAADTLKLIKTNPAANVRLPMKRAEPKQATRKHDRVVVPEETMQEVLKRFSEGHPCHIPLQLGYRCGMRLGEVFGISWNDIDFEKKTLTVRQQVQMDEATKQWRIVPPKYDSTREILLDSVTYEMLKRAKEQQELNEKNYAELHTCLYLDSTNHITTDSSGGTPFYPVNIRENGTYIAPRVMQHAFRVISGKDNPQHKNPVYSQLHYEFDFHSLRHTHATMLLSAGVSPVVVKERLGHKNIETTLGIYAHVTDKMNDGLLTALNDIK